MIFIAKVVDANTPSVAKQTKNLPRNIYLKHIELAEAGETGVPVIIGEEEDDVLLTSPDLVEGAINLANAEELLQAVLLDIEEGNT